MSDTYPYWLFDNSPIDDPAIFETPSGEIIGGGERAVRFIRALRHPKTGKPFQLDRWQERLIRRIYGPRDADGHRIVEEVVMMIPRGGRKTTLGAALALLHSIGPERVPHGQVILAAYDREQARIAYDEASGIVAARKETKAATRVRDFVHEIEHRASGATLKAVSSDAAAQNGKTPSFVLIDEIHAWKKRGLYDVLRTGLTKTENTLCVVISQAGRGTDNLADEAFGYARRVAAGEITKPSLLPVIFETPKDADWRDEALWHRANPGLKFGYPVLKKMRTMAEEAENRPAIREKFRNDHLNIWLDKSTDPFVDMSIYDKGSTPIDLDALAGAPCWIGVDMSTTTDLTAVVAAFRDPDDEDGFVVIPHFFIPGDNVRARGERDGVPYPTWAEEGHLTPTPGNVIDYRAVEQHIRDLADRFDVREIGFDRAYAMPVMSPLQEDGFPVLTIAQAPVQQSGALATLERAIIGGKLQHGGHPVLRWNFANIAVQTGSTGLRTMNKGKSTDRIDGAVACWMAVSRAAANDAPPKSILLSENAADYAAW
ncbi:terminase TerL endonuclease subunit [Fulvimarina sp. 2208YS6-2-32]|uniref:Terminase TerL endonuclease subunit n=1 Tax=Fulvimarina uroteuthidis TaxID=3098149 RepID=A0ABU5I6Z5_9HYPH|nr:terminase TerL endonuclease subunit [Fulvimarina sp. 2208YS6-2-32]MDY8111165.1 terminase TerL endonuclease subunit [Fulvimarina sp. 2208YS6-2-32]